MERKNSSQFIVHRSLMWMGILIVVFFILYVLPLRGIGVFNSPDENANAVFTQFFATHGSLQIPASYIGPGAEYLTPRSITYRDGFYVPGSFIGLPLLYGSITRILNFAISYKLYAISYLTPLFAIFGLLAFFGIIRRVFNDRIAFISTLLLALHPAWWYWASRAMMPNVLFVSLVLVGIYFLLKEYGTPSPQPSPVKGEGVKYNPSPLAGEGRVRGIFWSLLSGIFIGLALLVRTFDMVLLAPAIIALLWRKSFWSLVGFLIPVALSGILLLNMNTVLYGSPFSFAYVPPSSLGADTPIILSPYHLLVSYLFPFGFHPRLALRNFLDYGIELFWWWSIPLGYGLWVFVRLHVIPREARNPLKLLEGILRFTQDDRRNKYYVFLFTYLYIFVIFVLIYGSGKFFDHPDSAMISLGNSYTRYWLPLYILSVPFVGLVVSGFLEWAHSARPTNSANSIRVIRGALPIRVILAFVVTTLFLTQNVYAIFIASDVSLLSIRSTLKGYAMRQEKVLSLTSADAVIITSRYDKLFWPRRTVTFSLEDSRLRALLPLLLEQHPLYYYSWNPERDIAALNSWLSPLGFAVIGNIPIFAAETLLEIKKKPQIM